ncbi:rapamycin-insensitive companion of mTOR-like [Zerene cesonia]|uniref:rapamycin-insensitive companion of mTOR-like n=1 Tax=Zerene cesonia TaxID=33412 RepID=UPI0018E50382|nr:rapamycin-insensitive companion of mTOR-like [Zerene cesonia]
MNLSNNFLEDSVPVHVVRLAKYCPVYSVRATAFYVLGLIGSTYDGANLLAELGWFCVRHTRHDQFPIISEDNYAIGTESTEKSHFYVTSPDRRFNALDIDLSEHSDHTDQSTADSVHSESARLNKTIGAICIEENQDVVDHKISFDRREPDKRKSHTLPSQGCSSSHERSLTESRTVDILRDCSTYERTGHKMQMENRLLGRMNSLDQAHEGRVRNTSESSTSGVSSCDSFLGKYAIPDRVLTLSPIPSSSSLYGMKTSVPHRPRLAETQRRISTSSFTGPDAASSPPTQMDMSGYATIQSLNKHRRPHVSEGAATSSSDIDELVWLLPDFSRRGKPYSSMREKSKSHRERMAKLSLVEDDWRPLWQTERAGAAGAGRAVRPAPRAPRAAPPHYMGVCLPLHLADIFPDEDIKAENVNGDKIVPSRTRVPSFLDSSIASADNKSRATPDSQNIANKDIPATTVAHRPLPLTITKPALNDAMETAKIIEEKTAEEHAKTNITADKNHIIVKDTECAEAGLVKDVSSSTAVGSTLVGTLSRVESKPSKWRHAARDCLACVRTRPPSSHELREAFFADMEGVSATEDRTSPPSLEPTPQAQLLHNVLFMSNPIHLKQTRSALLSLKQRHPDVFRSACVYSDVCAVLARDTYMLCARRFLQELFLDTNFECFDAEPAAVLARHGAPAPPAPPAPPNVEA